MYFARLIRNTNNIPLSYIEVNTILYLIQFENIYHPKTQPFYLDMYELFALSFLG
jgi:hypothetical protein